MRHKYRKRSACLLGLWLLLLALPARACDVPVFRYALERWAPDPYQAIVFHPGTLVADDQVALDRLRVGLADEKQHANIVLLEVDLSMPVGPALQELWEAQADPELPWMVVRNPKARRIDEYVWAGSFGASAVELLVDSPIRREIARRILDGDSAVWVLLEGGHQAKDDAAARLLSARLKALQDTLELPVPSEPGSAADGISDLWIAFSFIRLSRADARELALVRMLLKSEWDLESSSAPIAFPVFGRGRLLYALVGGGISEHNIREACAFIVGACSCQIKDLSPGTDLLMSVDWMGALDGQVQLSADVPPVVGMSAFVEAARSVGGDPGATKAAAPSRAVEASVSSPFKRNLVIVLLGAVVCVALASLILRSRKQAP